MTTLQPIGEDMSKGRSTVWMTVLTNAKPATPYARANTLTLSKNPLGLVMYTFNFIFAPKLASVDPRQVYSIPLGIVSDLNIRKESRKYECPFGNCSSSRCKNMIFENAPPNFLEFATLSD